MPSSIQVRATVSVRDLDVSFTQKFCAGPDAKLDCVSREVNAARRVAGQARLEITDIKVGGEERSEKDPIAMGEDDRVVLVQCVARIGDSTD